MATKPTEENIERVKNYFLNDMFSFFSMRSSIDKDRFAEYATVSLGHFERKVLRMAFEHFTREKKLTSMPSIADMGKVCEEILEELNKEAQPEDPEKAAKARMNAIEEAKRRQAKEWTSERREAAMKRLKDCPFARAAVQDGWIGRLWDHYRKFDQEPTHSQTQVMQASLMEERNIFKRYPEGVAMFKQAIARRDLRRQELVDYVLNGTVPERGYP